MKTMIAIQTGIGGDKFVTDNVAYPLRGMSYRYTHNLRDALLFLSIDQAIKWIERTSFYNGQGGQSGYSGSPRLTRVEVTEMQPVILLSYRAVGPVE